MTAQQDEDEAHRLLAEYEAAVRARQSARCAAWRLANLVSGYGPGARLFGRTAAEWLDLVTDPPTTPPEPPVSTPDALPAAQTVLAIIAAEHMPYTAPGVRERTRYCSACTHGTVVLWPCRVHELATQPTAELAALGARPPRKDTP